MDGYSIGINNAIHTLNSQRFGFVLSFMMDKTLAIIIWKFF